MTGIILGRARHSVRAVVAFALAASPASVFCGDRHIAFERDQAVWIARVDGTGEKKISDGIFPAISPDGSRVAFNTKEKTSDTTYAPSWTADEKQILFATRPHEAWDFVVVNADGANFRALKPGV